MFYQGYLSSSSIYLEERTALFTEIVIAKRITDIIYLAYNSKIDTRLSIASIRASLARKIFK
jgi:hypothetical protein